MENLELENKEEQPKKRKKREVNYIKCVACRKFLGHNVGDAVKVPKDKFDYMKKRGYVKGKD